MTEKDIRDHINAFLRNKLQALLVPASMGLGLALGGCDASALSSNPDGSGDTSSLVPGAGGATSPHENGGATGTLYGMGGFVRGGAGGAGGTTSGGSGGNQGGIYGFPPSGGGG